MPAFTAALVTEVPPVMPLIGVGPAAASVQAVGSALPPLSLVTVLLRVRCAPMSLLLIVHVTFAPLTTTTELPVTIPPVHDQAPAV